VSHGNKGLLHRNSLDAFVAWLEARGWVKVEVNKNHGYELVRLRRETVPSGRPDVPIQIYKRNGTEHLSVVNGFELVEQWLRERLP
jgi:hypothetical protein